jgi:hypothetical protein
MNKEKWMEIYEEIINKTQLENGKTGLCPENWPKDKKLLNIFINEVDEATEVYNMENKGK